GQPVEQGHVARHRRLGVRLLQRVLAEVVGGDVQALADQGRRHLEGVLDGLPGHEAPDHTAGVRAGLDESPDAAAPRRSQQGSAEHDREGPPLTRPYAVRRGSVAAPRTSAATANPATTTMSRTRSPVMSGWSVSCCIASTAYDSGSTLEIHSS